MIALPLNRIGYEEIKHRAENGIATNQDCLDLIEFFGDAPKIAFGKLSQGKLENAIRNAVSYDVDIEVDVKRVLQELGVQ
jgi:hypothetical protein